jgi:5'-nucleotidase
VISGINKGLNMGRDIMYSGTVGAVLEAGNLGVQAIAFSTEPKNYDHATEHLDRIWAFIQEHKLLQRNDLYNINIPKDAGSIRITRQGGPYYSDEFINLENSMVSPHGIEVFVPCGNMEIDTDAVLCGKLISIMPLTLEKTDLQVFGDLKYLNN